MKLIDFDHLESPRSCWIPFCAIPLLSCQLRGFVPLLLLITVCISCFFFLNRSIWTCAPRQNSIPPASLTLAAPAPPAMTLCSPTTRWRMSPACPSTSTSMETSKHEAPPWLASVENPWMSLSTYTHACTHTEILQNVLHHQTPSGSQWTNGPQLGLAWWQSCCHTLILPCRYATPATWSHDVLKEMAGILQKLLFPPFWLLTEWTSDPASPPLRHHWNSSVWFSCSQPQGLFPFFLVFILLLFFCRCCF